MSAPLPQRETFLQKLPVAGALLLLPLGASVLAGWFLHRPALTTWGAGPAVPLHGALGLMLFGLALLGRDRFGRSWAAAALLPALAGMVDLAADLSLLSGGVGRWLGGEGAQAPAMVPVLAAGFALAGWAATLVAFGPRERWRVAVVAGVGSLVGGAGLAAVLGHATGLVAATTLGLGGALALPGAVGLLVVGCALVAVAVEERPDLSRPARWLPVPLMFGCLAATLVVWSALRQREFALVRAELDLRAEALAAVLAVELAGPERALERIVAREDLGQEYTLRLRQTDAQGLLREHREVERVAWLDAEFRPLQVWTPAGEVKAGPFEHLGDPRRKAALERARRSGAVEVLGPADDPRVRPTVMLYVALRRGAPNGFVSAELDAQRWAEVSIERIPAAGRDLAGLGLGGHTLLGAMPAEAVAAPGVDRGVSIGGLPVRLVLARTLGFGLPEVVFGSGVGFALLLGLVVDLGQKARARQTQAERTMARLVAEDAERRKVELRLKASEERLTLALEAGQVGVFDFDLITGEAMFSRNVWKMLGRTEETPPGRTASWIELIHPDDLGVAKREFPRGPQPGFAEAEYRVRSVANEWRWILERSKAVAFANDGVPRRIAGTFQDVTARHEAEQALRSSQAEARKLAVVASITDNWVVITDAAGAVEWVNESCCRMMNRLPAEVAGRPLAEVLPPPAPDEEGASSALREPFVRRLPVRVEIATVSRHGRRFHLQGEIHPVAGERGEVAKFIAVFHDISARIEAERALRQAMDEAKAATDAKSDFLASMSHEIRTPMNGVIGLARLLLESPLNAEQQDWVRTIQQSGDALLSIINDILDFSKIESGRMELETAPFDLADCVEEALELFGVAAGAKHLDLAYNIAPGVPEVVRGDALRLRQVLVNLVGNAVKFTPAGRIGVEVQPGPEPEHLVFRITDTGIGIPPERIDSLFQPFKQGDASLSRRFGGTGLGLAICRRLVELMGGSIGVSARPNGGSIFHFTVRLAAEAAAGAGAPVPGGVGRRVAVVEDDPVTQRLIVRVLEDEGSLALCYESLAAARAALASGLPPDLLLVDRTLPDADGLAAAAALRALFSGVEVPVVLLAHAGDTPTRAELAAAGVRAVAVKPLRRRALRDRLAAVWSARPASTQAARAEAPAPTLPCLGERLPLRVLLAEDNPVNKKVALRLLERLGYRAEAVANGNEAVRAVAAGDYQLVFMDLQMPELDGLEATRRIREDLPPGRQPVIIALTANAIAGDAERCRAAGMDDYVSKPVTPEAIYNAIVRRFGAGLGLEPLAEGGLA